MRTFYKKHGAFFTCGIALVLTAADRQENMLSAPEVEIRMAQTQLESLQKNIMASRKLRTNHQVETQNLAANSAFARAVTYFNDAEYLSVIRELNDFLNLTQIPNSENYLKAQYMLARAYELEGMDSRAIRAYLRYVSTFITMKNAKYDDLMSVMQNLIPLAIKKDLRSDAEMKKLLSSVVSLDVPEQHKAELLFYAGSAALKNGEPNYAIEWLKKSEESTANPTIKLRAAYFLAIHALIEQNYEAAQSYLENIEAIAAKSDAKMRDLAAISSARIAVRLKKPALAAEHYQKIPEDSSYYHDALFESVYVHLSLENNQKAKELADSYLKKFPDKAESLQIQTLLGYFDLRRGAIAEARNNIKSADEGLVSFLEWLNKNFASNTRLSYFDVKNLIAKSALQVPLPSKIIKGNNLFATLSELRQRLADSKGAVQNIVFTLGRTTPSQFKPSWIRKYEQIDLFSDEIQKIGHRLASTMFAICGDKLTKVDNQAWNASLKRRLSYRDQTPKLLREKSRWVNWINLHQLTTELAKKNQSLNQSRANLAAAKFLNRKDKNFDQKQEQYAKLESKFNEMQESISQALLTLRSYKVFDLLTQSPHSTAAKLHLQYTNALLEEYSLVFPHLDGMNTPSVRYLAKDIIDVWEKWNYINKSIHEEFVGLHREIKQDVENVIDESERLMDKHVQIQDRLENTIIALEKSMGQSLADFRGHFVAAIGERQSKHRKWYADLDWLEYSQTVNQQDDLGNKFRLEEQILQDNLRDLQQGVLWQ